MPTTLAEQGAQNASAGAAAKDAAQQKDLAKRQLAGMDYDDQVAQLDPASGAGGQAGAAGLSGALDPLGKMVNGAREAFGAGWSEGTGTGTAPVPHTMAQVFVVESDDARLRTAPPALKLQPRGSAIAPGTRVLIRQKARHPDDYNCVEVQEVAADGTLGAVVGWTRGNNLGRPRMSELAAGQEDLAAGALGVITMHEAPPENEEAPGVVGTAKGVLTGLSSVMSYFGSTLGDAWGGKADGRDPEAEAKLAGKREAKAAAMNDALAGKAPQAQADGTKNTLETALALEEQLRAEHANYGTDEFNGYGYGDDQYVCSTFTEKVLEEAGYDLNAQLRAEININIAELAGLKGEDFYAKLDALVMAGDERTKGVVKALASSGQGREVVVGQEALEPGDFVQYWYWSKGHLFGHSVQVQKVNTDGTVNLHGSHSSKKGVGTLTSVNLTKMAYAYAARPAGNGGAGAASGASATAAATLGQGAGAVGATGQAAQGQAGQAKTSDAPPAPQASTKILSGASWYDRANSLGWSNSTDFASLDPTWGAKCQTFVEGLRASGASVEITAGLRHPKRAKLMHYAWNVSRGAKTPEEANTDCQADGIDINWDHGDLATSKSEAGKLKSAFALVAEPSLTSNHIRGKAVDMNIKNVPAKVTIGGKSYDTEAATRGSFDEDKVDHIGKQLGVIWYGPGDDVHWSHTGR